MMVQNKDQKKTLGKNNLRTRYIKIVRNVGKFLPKKVIC